MTVDSDLVSEAKLAASLIMAVDVESFISFGFNAQVKSANLHGPVRDGHSAWQLALVNQSEFGLF